MKRIPQSFIDQLLRRVDIAEVVGRYVSLKKKGKDLYGCCPFHDEKTPSFSVSEDKQFFYCFGCSASGTALVFVQEMEGLRFPDAVRSLAAAAGMDMPEGTSPKQGNGRGAARRPGKASSALADKPLERPPPNRAPPPRVEHRADPHLSKVVEGASRYYADHLANTKGALSYLKERGINEASVARFSLGFAGHKGLIDALGAHPVGTLIEAGLVKANDDGKVYDFFRSRLIFPIRDAKGTYVGMAGRKIDERPGPKYINIRETPIFQKGALLYGLDLAAKAHDLPGPLIIVEGHLDVIAMHQRGIATSVAGMGTALTADQITLAFEYRDKMLCCFDGDPSGLRAAWRAVENVLPLLNETHEMRLAFLPEGEDPDSLLNTDGGRAILLDHLNDSVPAEEYLVRRLTQDLDLEKKEDREALADTLKPYLEMCESEAIRKRISRVSGDLFSGRAVPDSRPPPPPPKAPYEKGAAPPTLPEAFLAMAMANSDLLHALSDRAIKQIAEEDGFPLLSETVNHLLKKGVFGVAPVLRRYGDAAAESRLITLSRRASKTPREDLTSSFYDAAARLTGLSNDDLLALPPPGNDRRRRRPGNFKCG